MTPSGDDDRESRPRSTSLPARLPPGTSKREASKSDEPKPVSDEAKDEKPAEAPEDKFEEELNQRLKEFLLKNRAVELKENEDKLAARQEQLLREAKDERAAIMKAVAVTVPDLTDKLFEKMDEMSIDKHSFTKDTSLFDLAAVKLKEAKEFFDLKPAERDDLLDRVGFYRGMIIDHRQSNPVQPSFRDVLQRPQRTTAASSGGGLGSLLALGFGSDAAKADKDKPAETLTGGVRVLYRKPNFAGFFENLFTASEAVHQSQKNGVTNLKFSLAASGGVATRVGVGIGVGYSEQSQFNEGGVTKKVYITSSFYLPKVELSFDNLRPCVDEDFVAAVRRALEEKTLEPRFQALKRVLDVFGHFIPASTLVGGRLFSTDVKDYTGAETGSDVTKRFNAEIKAMFSAPTASGEMSASVERSTQEAAKAKSTNEQQSMTIHAMGGDGGVIRNAAVWVESMGDYRRWSAVQRENLQPTIDLLPKALADSCWSTLKDYAETRTKRALLFDEDAYFMFYGDYGEKVGVLAKETYFAIRNPAWGTVLTVSDLPPVDGSLVALAEACAAETQVWRMSPEGHLLSRSKRSASAYGKKTDVEFALTVITPAHKDKTADVQMRLMGRAPLQGWEYTGSGQLVCAAFGADYVLTAEASGRAVLRSRSENADASQIWDLVEITDISAVSRPVGQADPAAALKLRIADNGLVLTARGGEGRGAFGPGETLGVVMMPDIGGAHQLWRKTEDGRITSEMPLTEGGIAQPLLLTLLAEDGAIGLRPATANLKQRWSFTTEGYLAPLGTKSTAVATVGQADGLKRPGQGISMTPRQRAKRQIWSLESQGAAPDLPIWGEITNQDDAVVGDYNLKMIDTRPLPVNGEIVGLEYHWFERGGIKTGKCLQYRICVRKSDGSTTSWVQNNDDPASSDYNQIGQEQVYAETKMLYLPAGPIAQFRIAFKPGTRVLTPMYRLKTDGDWIYPEDDGQESLSGELEGLSAYGDAKRQASALQSVTAIGLTRNPTSRILGYRLLTGARPGHLPAGQVLAPGHSTLSPNGKWELLFDERRRLIMRSSAGNKEDILWEVPAGTQPGAGWRVVIGAACLYVVADAAAAARCEPTARTSTVALSVQDDGNLVLYKPEANGSLSVISALKESTKKLQVKAQVS